MEQDPVSKQNTQRAKGYTRRSDLTCSRKEVISIFVEWHSHDPVSEVEGFLNSITMVDIDINVEHPRVVPGVMIKPWSGERGESPIFSSPTQAWEIFRVCFWPSHLKPHPTKFPPESPGLHPQARDKEGKGCAKGTEKSITDLRSQKPVGKVVRVGPSPRDFQVSKVSPLLLEYLLEQLQDANYNVIDIAEARGLWKMDL